MITLYKLNVNGTKMHSWTITNNIENLHIVYGEVNGLMQEKVVEIEENLSGRDMIQQAKLEYESRISKQLQRGYRYTISEAEEYSGFNELNFYRPMLAQKYNDVMPTDLENWLLQPKLDGHRCLITQIHGKKTAYSRNGKVIETIGHILDQISLDNGMTIDGELYLPNTPLQAISSLVKRKQPDTLKVQYYAFDIISNDDTRTRQALLDSICEEISGVSPIIRVPTFEAVDEHFDMYSRLYQARNNGYEGLIMRHKEYSYEVGKRSKGLLKVKVWQDKEFLVVDILKSRDGWAILRCNCGYGTFEVSAPGTMENKFTIANNPEHYIGKYITVNYANLTKDGKPFHPVAINFREDL